MFQNTNIDDTLKKYWGYSEFRQLQREAITSTLEGNDTLVILPTGGGKSICYQMQAALKNGLVLVISPLIALMDDQVASASEAGINAEALHSNLSEKKKKETYAKLFNNDLDLLYVSPERFNIGDLVDRLKENICLIAVDEAHCVSHWGHDFRPDYRRLAPLFNRLSNIPRIALTATATPRVQEDICNQLELRNPIKLVGHPDRPNLTYRSIPRKTGITQITNIIENHPDEGGIIYCLTRKRTEQLQEKLSAQGVKCEAYHAGLPAIKREKVQKDFVEEEIDVVIATIAFGMGIDRSNVRYVIHANTPKSIEHYQQESGRAGRDNLPADCVLLHSYSDIVMHRSLAERNGPMSYDRKQNFEKHLKDISRYATSPVCRHKILSEYFGHRYDNNNDQKSCEACDVCYGETLLMEEKKSLICAQKIISAVQRCNNSFGIGHVVDVLLGKNSEKIRKFEHDKLSVYSIMKENNDISIRTWIDQLILQDMLCVDLSTGFPIVQTTPQGMDVCRNKGTAKLCEQIISTNSKGSKKKKKTKSFDAIQWEGVNLELFAALKELRKDIAHQIGKPPYIVFSDASLREFASESPKTKSQFLAIKGAGDVKYKRYGTEFLDLIKKY